MNSVQVCCGEFTRIILFVLNFIFWAAGGVVLGIGIYVKVDVHKLHDIGTNIPNETLEDAAMVLIGLGCVIFVVGLLGCCGSLTQNRCMLLLYFTLVTIIFLGEIALAIAVYVKKDDVITGFRDGYDQCMESYGNATAPDHKVCQQTIDVFQETLKCCGRENATDWQAVEGYKTTPPRTCCPGNNNNNNNNNNTCSYDTAFNQGCFNTISDFVSDNAKYIGVAVLLIAVVELVGMTLACYLRTYILKRDEYEPYTV